jgi:two-component system sensor histidine kinase DegS
MGTDALRVSVEDNGRGFDTEAAEERNSLGLRLIKERVDMLGGTFTLDSAPGRGARIVFTIPLHA